MYGCVLKFVEKDGYFEYIEIQNYTSDHIKQLRRYYLNHFHGKEFKQPYDLVKYVKAKPRAQIMIVKSARSYLKYLNHVDRMDDDTYAKWTCKLKVPKSQNDYFVPTDDDVIENCKEIKTYNYKLIYVLLCVTGIRIREALHFLKTFRTNKFTIQDGLYVYDVSRQRGQKNINTIFIPAKLQKKLKNINISDSYLGKMIKQEGCQFPLKYLRKYNYNLLLYNKVPESVADYISGRSCSGSVSASHYLAKRSQAIYWYGALLENGVFDHLLDLV